MHERIRLNQINKVYGNDVKTQVLFDVDLSIEEGSFNSIIGASGSGKSTLLNLIGLLDTPTSGELLIQGKDTAKLSRKELAELRNETIGFIFQFHHLLPEFSVLENVLMPYRIGHSKLPKEILERAHDLLDFVGLGAVKNNRASNISGGQQQRAAIARALMNHPAIVLADEPTGNLDSEASENVYQLLRQINEEFGTTFIVVTHDQRIAEKADRIIEIRDGRIATDKSLSVAGRTVCNW